MKAAKITCLTLVLIGGINWGLVGFFDYNLVDFIFGMGSAISRTIYALVGVASILLIIGMVSKPMMDDDSMNKMMNK